MKYEAIEAAIAAQLQGLASAACVVSTIPENQQKPENLGDRSSVYVAFKMSNFDAEEKTADTPQGMAMSVGVQAQLETMIFEVEISSRKLRGSGGVYDLLEKALQALVGFRPLDEFEGLRIINEGYRRDKDNRWVHSFLCLTSQPLIENRTEDSPANLSNVFFNINLDPYLGGTSIFDFMGRFRIFQSIDDVIESGDPYPFFVYDDQGAPAMGFWSGTAVNVMPSAEV